MNNLSLEQLGQIIGLLMGLFGLWALLWRYLGYPVAKLLKKLKANSEKIVNSLPILFDLSARWPLQSGQSLYDNLHTINIDIARQRVAYRLFLDHFGMAAFETDKSGECIWVSEKWRDLTGLTKEEANGTVWMAGVGESDREKVAEEWFRCIEMGRQFNLHYSIVKKDGNVTAVHGIGHTIKVSGNVVGYFGLIKPV